MAIFEDFRQNMTRRYLFSQGSHLLGTASLAALLSGDLRAAASGREESSDVGSDGPIRL